MLCGTSERVPVSAFIHLLPRENNVSGVPCMLEIMREIMNVLEPFLPPVCDLAIDRDGGRVTHRVHVDRFQIIRVRVLWLLCTVGIESACDLKELLRDVCNDTSWRNPKRTICAVSRPSTRDLVILYLHFLEFRVRGTLSLMHTHFSQERDEVL